MKKLVGRYNWADKHQIYFPGFTVSKKREIKRRRKRERERERRGEGGRKVS